MTCALAALCCAGSLPKVVDTATAPLAERDGSGSTNADSGSLLDDSVPVTTGHSADDADSTPLDPPIPGDTSDSSPDTMGGAVSQTGEDTAGTGLEVALAGRWSGFLPVEDANAAWIRGATERRIIGYTIGDVGDVTGDGLADLAIGSDASGLDRFVSVHAGPLSGVYSDADGFAVWDSASANVQLVSGGDGNADGTRDLWSVAHEACIHYGPIAPGEQSLEALELYCYYHSDSLYVYGRNSNTSVMDRDLTGDGVPDGLLGMLYPDGGQAYLFEGPPTLGLVDESAALATFEGDYAPAPHTALGTVANAELDGDGLADVALGASGGADTRGEVLVALSPVPAGLFDPYGYDGVWEGEDIEHGLGLTLTRTGDINGDGLEDLLAAAGDWPGGVWSEQGQVYGITGPGTGEHDVGEAYAIFAAAPHGFWFGQGLAEAHDLDLDGSDDVIIGSEGGGYGFGGMIFVYYGMIDPGTRLSSEADAKFERVDVIDDVRFGQGLAAPGDLTGDGWPDLVGAAPQAPGVDGVFWGGEVFVIDNPGG